MPPLNTEIPHDLRITVVVLRHLCGWTFQGIADKIEPECRIVTQIFNRAKQRTPKGLRDSFTELTPTGRQQPPPPTTANSQTRYGPAPPPLDSINEVAIKAPRTYHRMIVEFETLKAAFYSAKASEFLSSPSTPRAQKSNPFTSQIPTISISARLLPSSRHPRATSGLYVSHARPNLSIPTLFHEHIITLWKEEFELWSDVLEDLTDPVQSKKDAATDLANNYLALAGLDEAKASAMAKPAAKPVAVAQWAEPLGAPLTGGYPPCK